MSDKHKIPQTPKRNKFMLTYGDLTPEEIQLESLYAQRIQNEHLYAIRNNTAKMVWFLIVIPIILGALIFLLGGLS